MIGAAWNGSRSFTSTSGPGISLMTEFIGLASFAEVPAVIVNVQRGGPSTGMPTRTQQSDLLSCAYASNGDTKHVLLFPEDPGECFDFTADALDLADRLQTPVFVMTDLDIGMNHRLCKPFHWDEQRVIDRGTRGINWVLSSMVFNVAPTLFEVAVVTTILTIKCGPPLAALTLGTLGAYTAFTFGVTSWRTGFRKAMNRAEAAANNRALDSLINYETVKYFGNERYEAERYDACMAKFQDAGVATQQSLSLLNLGQNALFSAALAAAMVLTARGVAAGTEPGERHKRKSHKTSREKDEFHDRWGTGAPGSVRRMTALTTSGTRSPVSPEPVERNRGLNSPSMRKSQRRPQCSSSSRCVKTRWVAPRSRPAA